MKSEKNTNLKNGLRVQFLADEGKVVMDFFSFNTIKDELEFWTDYHREFEYVRYVVCLRRTDECGFHWPSSQFEPRMPVGVAEVERAAKVMRKIRNTVHKMEQTWGAPHTVGQVALQLCKGLKLDTMIFIREHARTSWFCLEPVQGASKIDSLIRTAYANQAKAA